MSNITIRDIHVINTKPASCNLTVVKVETSEPELYGLGCATFTYRYKAVTSVIEDYYRELLAGRDVADIEDLWNLMHTNSYWRNGPVINNAISGIDMALWDIKGKMAGMPLYELLGGKSREGVAVYAHADGKTKEEVLENVCRYQEDGFEYVRVQTGGYGGIPKRLHKPHNSKGGVYYSPIQYFNETVELLDYIRTKAGNEIQLIHDVHERLEPIDGVRLAKALEPYRLFFLEDLLPPEQGEWYRMVRSQTCTPLAIGELFTDFKEYDYLVRERLIDFVRCHISALGGITPAGKLSAMAEMCGIRTAWHGPMDVSPVGHAANIQLDMHIHNFGIQEWSFPDRHEVLKEMFPGMPECRKGYVYTNKKPGLGIDIDEKLAAKYPCDDSVTEWTQTRVMDGTCHCP